MAPRIDFPTLYETIRTRIYLLEYPPGEALKEEKLAEEFGVSRTPVRRVLHRLEFEGLVTSKRGIGTLVTSVDVKELKEVYAFRLKLAKLAGELSSPRVTEDNIGALDHLLERTDGMRNHYDPKALALLYLEFHNEMMSLITNQPLRKIYDQLFHQTARVWLQILPDLDWEEEVQAVYEEIRDVIKALHADDIRTLASVRRNHLAMILHRFNQYLGGADRESRKEERV
jgi:DNA-binding GntR family transcriptional regulator